MNPQKRPRHQKTLQVFKFAARINSDFAEKIVESPKVTASAALLAFSKLDPAAQLEMIRAAREMHLRDVEKPTL